MESRPSARFYPENRGKRQGNTEGMDHRRIHRRVKSQHKHYFRQAPPAQPRTAGQRHLYQRRYFCQSDRRETGPDATRPLLRSPDVCQGQQTETRSTVRIRRMVSLRQRGTPRKFQKYHFTERRTGIYTRFHFIQQLPEKSPLPNRRLLPSGSTTRQRTVFPGYRRNPRTGSAPGAATTANILYQPGL